MKITIFDGINKLIEKYKLKKEKQKLKIIELEKIELINFFYSNLTNEYIEKYNKDIIKKYKGIIPGDKKEEDIKVTKLAQKQDLFESNDLSKIYFDIIELSDIQDLYKEGRISEEKFNNQYNDFIDNKKPKTK